MDITEQDIFSIIGIEVTEEERLDIETGLYNGAIIDLLENMDAVLGKEKCVELNNKVTEVNPNLDDLVKMIEDCLKANGKSLEEEIKIPLRKVYLEFIQDQINMLEKKVETLDNNDTKVVKQSLIKTLRDMLTNKEWDKMGDVFKRVDLYKIS